MEHTFNAFNLSSEITKALTNLKYITPTEVQREVIPKALEKKDLVVKSQTGSGKTAAFGIPISEMVDWEENKPQALILTPTRELAVQIQEDFTNIGRFKRLKAVAIFGKQSFEKQKLVLKQKTHVVVGTPGRVLDHIQKGTLNINYLKFLVLDEADEMLNMGFYEQVEAIIQELPTDRVTMLFSATLPEDIEKLCEKHIKSPIYIEIKSNEVTANKIEHLSINVREDKKFSLLLDLTVTENPDSSIIFCNTQDQVDHVFKQLKQNNYPCEKLHGDMKQESRFSVMNDFKKGKFRYLVATNVAARGIDIENISLVINYDVPFDKESYVHRTGRTGRAGKSGKAITFVTNYEEKYLNEIEEFLDFKIKKISGPTQEEVAKQKPKFEIKLKTQPTFKEDKGEKLNKDITKLYFNGGKKKKIRAIDFVGTISNLPGVTAEDIGIITIQDNFSYVDILNGKGSIVLQAMKNKTIKGKLLKVHIAKR